MSKRREFRELEKQVFDKCRNIRENEVVLENDDFKDGKLSWAGFTRMRAECQYVNLNEEIEIKIPSQYVDNFKENLETMATNELLHIRKDIRENRIKALIFFLIGCAVLAVGLFVDSYFRQEILFIISWVFVWAAAEKTFFDRKDLQDSRYNLLHILSARVVDDSADVQDDGKQK
ncbi:MAG: hypothetical protein FWE31_01245 [Firmicutes bacterium]|nr:hypothetical protein [Bacillota bacterium]